MIKIWLCADFPWTLQLKTFQIVIFERKKNFNFPYFSALYNPVILISFRRPWTSSFWFVHPKLSPIIIGYLDFHAQMWHMRLLLLLYDIVYSYLFQLFLLEFKYFFGSFSRNLYEGRLKISLSFKFDASRPKPRLFFDAKSFSVVT